MESLLIRPTRLDDVVAWTDSGLLRRWDIESQALALRDALLPASGTCVPVLLENRRQTLVVLLGAFLAKVTPLLVPRTRASGDFRDAAILVDGRAGATRREGVVALDEHGALVGGAAPRAMEHAFDISLQADRIALAVLTSGTSGQPEVHEKTAAQIFREARAISEFFSMNSEAIVCATVPSHHLYGALFGVLAPLAGGARLVFARASEPSGFEPRALSSLLEASGATHLVTVPAHLRSLLEAGVSLGRLEQVISSAAPLAPEVAREVEAKTGVSVFDVLGSTEAGGIGRRRPAKDDYYLPFPGVSVTEGSSGQLVVRSPFAPPTVDVFETGEQAEVLPDGRFLHLGREDGIVKVGGKRSSLQEIERAVRALPGVVDAALLATGTDGLRGTAIWLLVAGEGLRPMDVRRQLRAVLDPVFVPRKIRVVASLPRDERGKLPRAQLLPFFAQEGSPLGRNRDVTFEDWVATPALEAEADGGGASSPKGVTVLATLSPENRRFIGHFEGEPLLPGVALLIDLVLPLLRRLTPAPVVGLRRVKWTRPIRPGDRVRISVTETEPNGRYRFQITDDASEESAASGALLVRAAPFIRAAPSVRAAGS